MLLTLKQIAAELGMGYEALYKAAKRGRPPAPMPDRKVGQVSFYHHTRLPEWFTWQASRPGTGNRYKEKVHPAGH